MGDTRLIGIVVRALITSHQCGHLKELNPGVNYTTLCSFKRQLKSFYFKRLYNVFDGDNVRSFKIICPKCRRVNILKACSC